MRKHELFFISRISDSEFVHEFRIMKPNIGLRPVYVWTSNHIYRLITACVLALPVVRLVQSKLKERHTPLRIFEICSVLHDSVLMVQESGTRQSSRNHLRCLEPQETPS